MWKRGGVGFFSLGGSVRVLEGVFEDSGKGFLGFSLGYNGRDRQGYGLGKFFMCGMVILHTKCKYIGEKKRRKRRRLKFEIWKPLLGCRSYGKRSIFL